eukprot:CAMPEP_0176074916 /NCGR_PEP_ID=MMETSP0120_2-20121206/37442_1 /TAXON_ID=160619 /ORGANISM="Kryptoperidinium foliaceum, Strain CCMP 1326" /LENGTH=107 /DNA_ID=CAMNT_0017408617 /DNA_START=29 /DNA_END=348 /DNA_ORIENTATION=-
MTSTPHGGAAPHVAHHASFVPAPKPAASGDVLFPPPSPATGARQLLPHRLPAGLRGTPLASPILSSRGTLPATVAMASSPRLFPSSGEAMRSPSPAPSGMPLGGCCT